MEFADSAALANRQGQVRGWNAPVITHTMLDFIPVRVGPHSIRQCHMTRMTFDLAHPHLDLVFLFVCLWPSESGDKQLYQCKAVAGSAT